MALENKGITSPFTIFTSIITGGLFPLLGAFFAYTTGVVADFKDLYWTGMTLTALGGFLAHYLLAHTIHDLYHYEIEKRTTFSRRTLKVLLMVSILILLGIAIFLTIETGWPIMVFAIIGVFASMYAEGLLHSEYQMAIGAMFLVIGSFYVQVGYYHHGGNAFSNIDGVVWLRLLLLSLFAFFSQYGWLLFYRLDDYGWSPRMRNKSILLTKMGLPFLIMALAWPM